MNTKTALVAGGTKGIGKEIARGLVHRGMRVFIVGRNTRDGEKSAREIGAEFIQTDLSSMRAVTALAQTVKTKTSSLDVLVHSADVIVASGRAESVDGIELSFATNFLSRFVLNDALIALLRKPEQANIIHVAAAGMPIGLDLKNVPPKSSSFSGHTVGQASNDLYGLALAERLRNTDIAVNVLNPGFVDTEIRRKSGGLMTVFSAVIETLFRSKLTSAAQSAQLPLRLIDDPQFARDSGVLLMPGPKQVRLHSTRHSLERQNELWRRTEDLLRSLEAVNGLTRVPRVANSA
jgi:NAD(P)-dependent dehydrogenase (short-subunit alcohol dehydrogenase family)